jgi:uncharacterized protein (TIGR00661 family)
MKILYAASNNQNAKIQLSRFLDEVGTSHQIKIAAYKKSSPKDVHIDWTLDALLNIYRPDLLTLHNDNLNIYYEQVKSFEPDVVISDLEYFTSYIANDLNITMVQCSSSLINYALSRGEKYNLGLFKFHAHSLNRDAVLTQKMVNIIDNSNCNFVYSHYGDVEQPPKLREGFEWVRPYHQVAKDYIPCQHFITAGLSGSNKRVLDVLKRYPDSVVFMEDCHEQHANLLVKDIRIADEYYCNLRNSAVFVCQGQASFLADAFYNGKFSVIYPDYEDVESITHSHLADKAETGRVTTYEEDLADLVADHNIQPNYSESVKYLHERIEEL